LIKLAGLALEKAARLPSVEVLASGP